MKSLIEEMNAIPSEGQQLQKKKSPLEGGLLGAFNRFGGFLGEASGAGSFGRVTSEFGKDVVQGGQGLSQAIQNQQAGKGFVSSRHGEGLSTERTKRVVGEGLQAAAGVAS